MREPAYCFFEGGESIPFSQLPAHALRVAPNAPLSENADPSIRDFFDPDFRRIYASILLRERGLCGL